MNAPMNPPDTTAALEHARRERHKGILFAASAYVMWGFIPLYFKPLAEVAPLEIIAHRVVWCVLLLGLFQIFGTSRGSVLRVLRQPKTMGLLALSATLIATNWLIFVYAVATEQVLQTSLGYYINPLINVALGLFLLKERLRPLQLVAVGIAAMAVVLLVGRYGQFPWIALTLAFSFGAYGLIRKHVPVASADGLLAETLMMLPLALGYMAWLAWQGTSDFLAADWGLRGYLMLVGPVSTVPLLCFASGARRLPFTTLGFLQYLAPSLSFTLAVVFFGEPFGKAQAVTFGLIWVALALYSLDLVRQQRGRA
jgi:chloramphenicol-sensitive protein RarD